MGTPLRLSPVTRDRAVAGTWFEEMPASEWNASSTHLLTSCARPS
jgi:hypothetical protein